VILAPYPYVDVVFVIDVSGSMVAPLMNLEAEVGMVDAALQAKSLPSAPHYGLVVFVDDVIVMNAGEAYADIASLTTAVRNEVTTTTVNSLRQADAAIAEGNWSWPENTLDALHAAATGARRGRRRDRLRPTALARRTRAR
jgi:hypothetical protein